MDKKEIESLINEKEDLHKLLLKEYDKLVDAKSSAAYQESDLWLQTIWEDVITGQKVTDKTKEAYIKGHLREYKEQIEFIENKIKGFEYEIRIIDDKLKFLGGINDC